jgi:hypothetical protein
MTFGKHVYAPLGLCKERRVRASLSLSFRLIVEVERRRDRFTEGAAKEVQQRSDTTLDEFAKKLQVVLVRSIILFACGSASSASFQA